MTPSCSALDASVAWLARSRPACRPISIANKPSRCTGPRASCSNGSHLRAALDQAGQMRGVAHYRCVHITARSAVAACLICALTKSAAADFRLCNNTGSRVGVAIGYKDAEDWTTEGWWNLPSHMCETMLKGNLTARCYYIYAVDYDALAITPSRSAVLATVWRGAMIAPASSKWIPAASSGPGQFN